MSNKSTCPLTIGKIKKSNYRKLYIAYLIDNGVNTKQGIVDKTKMSERTIQKSLGALSDLCIVCEKAGGIKNRTYNIVDWAAIDRNWVFEHINEIENALLIDK